MYKLAFEKKLSTEFKRNSKKDVSPDFIKILVNFCFDGLNL